MEEDNEQSLTGFDQTLWTALNTLSAVISGGWRDVINLDAEKRAFAFGAFESVQTSVFE